MPSVPTFRTEKLFCSSRIVTPLGTVSGAIVVREGSIVEIVEDADATFVSSFPGEILDFGSHFILPGVIDGHVHMNEPGRTEWEGAETATQAAAAGGVTTIVDMPLNSSPVTISLMALEAKRQSVADKCWVDVGFHGGVVGPTQGTLTSRSTPEDVQALIDNGVLGIKVFLCDSGLDEFPLATERELEWLMPMLANENIPLWVHAELVPPTWRSPSEFPKYSDWPASRSKAFETDAIELLVKLCRRFMCPIHIVHLSNAGALPRIRRAKHEGLPLTVETCPHYLYFASESIPPRDPRFKCCPPIRELENRHLLWQGLELGEIDTLGSDHSPCPPSMKYLDDGDFAHAWGGIASLQLALPIIWDTAQRYEVPISRIVECLSSRPAQILRLESIKGSIEPGKLADLVILDPDAVWTVVGSTLFHRHKVTPYEGSKLTGQVVATYVQGNCVYREGSLSQTPLGKLLK